MSNRIRFDKSDISLEEVPVEYCSECGTAPATHYIMIVLRGVGEESSLGNSVYCLPCGTETVTRIQDSMPEPLNEDGTFDDDKREPGERTPECLDTETLANDGSGTPVSDGLPGHAG